MNLGKAAVPGSSPGQVLNQKECIEIHDFCMKTCPGLDPGKCSQRRPKFKTGRVYFMRQTDIIAPSILSADFAQLGDEVNAVLNAGAQWIHFDVMDNHYVPNLTVGAMVCQALIKHGITAPIDVHLMVKPVDSLIDAFAKAGASLISFHPDATDDVNASIKRIRQHGVQVGIALNPDVSADVLDSLLDKIDLVLLMSVYPGFGGQAFISDVLDKIADVRQRIDNQSRVIRLSVDGGINKDTIAPVANAGADTFVAGSAIFNQADYAVAIKELQKSIADGRG